jgi:hypothetical protein
VGFSAGLKFDVAGEETPMLEKCRARPIVPNRGFAKRRNDRLPNAS